MKKLTKLTSALMVMTALGVCSAPVFAAVQPNMAKVEERKARKTQIVGERVGKVLVKAFELYNEDKVNEAIAALLDVSSSNEFDTATLNRFLGNLYATKDEKQAIKYLTLAVKPDVLTFADQASSMKLLADMLLQDKQYQKAIKAYEDWIMFTGEQNSDAYMRIANAYWLMTQYDKVLSPADDAIRFAAKPIEGPYQLKMAALYELKRYKELVAVVETMVQLFPENKQFWVYLGNFYTLTEEYGKALATLQMAYSQGYLEKDSEVRMLAQMYANNNIPYKAAVTMEKHMKSGLVKKDKTNLNFIASNFQSAREFAKAADYYGELAKLTNDADAYRRQGSAYSAIQKYNEAIAAYDKALSLNVDKPSSVYMSLVDAYFYQKKYKEAYAALMNAKKDPAMSRQVRSWESYIRDKAKQKGISL
ncbi:tetratricopeptide repeat protein [Rheinheimera nanhaiensis]|uniref:TPR repeat-containing protein n=1 Tax=Rheinheimera nanhaiensis E407-8 TaxID=562729 RepID=I1DTY0_9GAMM|nr:tetratricopeptide repeat protein [Rheinheimera nanhaiensis]GAB57508.1 TPR repeat-containing protein [Rheinheimera nanhaiensis E407-8]